MLKKVFECDNKSCAGQSAFTYEIKVEVRKLVMPAGNGDAKGSQPKTFTTQVCSQACALTEIEALFRKQKIFDRGEEA